MSSITDVRAVLVGVADYQHLNPIPSALANVARLQEILTDRQLGTAATHDCVVLTRSNITGRHIMAAVRDVGSSPAHLVVFYFVGHGLIDPYDRGQLYLALPDSNDSHMDLALSWEHLNRAIRESLSQVENYVIVLDCCYSGLAITRGLGTEPSRDGVSGRHCVLTATAATQRALAPVSARYTTFTYALTEVLAGGIGGEQEFLTVRRIFDEVKTVLSGRSMPIPGLGTYNGGEDITVVRNAAYHPSPSAVTGNEAERRIVNTVVSPPPRVVGRDTELEILAQTAALAMREHSARLCVITGPPGVGKTTLLRLAATQADGRVWDTRLEFDLRGPLKPGQQKPPTEMLGDLLRTVGYRPSEIPAQLLDRRREWQRWLRDRRTILLLDNVVDGALIWPLLPDEQSTNLTLLGCRHPVPAIQTAKHIELRPLSIEDSVALLRPTSSYDTSDSALAHIADLCGRLPLALHMAVPLVGSEPAAQVHERLATVAAAAESARSGMSAAQITFLAAYQSLSAQQKRILDACSQHPGPDFSAASISALSEMAVQAVVSRNLDQLKQRHLLNLVRPDRYAFHSLIQQFASSLASQAGIVADQPRDRLFSFLLDRLNAALTELLGLGSRRDEYSRSTPFDTPEQALHWLIEATEELMTASITALHTRWHDAEVFARQTGRCLRLCDRLQSAFIVASELLQASVDSGDLLGQSDAHWARGQVHRGRSEYDLAVSSYSRARAVAYDNDDPIGVIEAAWGLAEAARACGDYPQAEQHLAEARQLAQEHDDRQGLADVEFSSGEIALARHDNSTAATHFLAARSLFAEQGDRRGEADVSCSLGKVHCSQGEFDIANTHFETARRLFRQVGNRRGLVETALGLGETASLQGQHTTAATQYDLAHELAIEIGDRQGQADASRGLGRTAHARGDDVTAQAYLDAALTLYTDIGDRPGQANTWLQNAELAELRGDLHAAIKAYHTAEQLFWATGLENSAQTCAAHVSRVGRQS